jgi:hypothetical protein
MEDSSITPPNTLPETTKYYITATADSGANISPYGKQTVNVGDKIVFSFSAVAGYEISAVFVDGVALSQKHIDAGFYMFYDVRANHTIEVVSAEEEPVLEEDDPVVGEKPTEKEDDSDLMPLIIAGIVLLMIIGILLWFILFGRKRYDVIKVETSAAIVGKDKVRRKSAYHFSIENGKGTVTYRIGEYGTLKTILPGSNGEYVIPKGEITDTVTVECK